MSLLLAWTFNALYLCAITLASPWILWSALRHGKYREGFKEKLLGLVPQRSGDRPCVWLHAVSVGEVNLLATTLREFRIARPDWQLVISTTTKAGYGLARKKYSDHPVFYCPLDFSWAVKRALRRIRPQLLILAELELWPNLLGAAKEQGVPVAIINGRLSDKSFRGYVKIRPLVARVLREVDLVAAQNRETAERFLQLGARSEAVHITGSLKFDGATTDRDNPRTRELRHLAKISDDDVVLLFGSTQAPEEAIGLELFRKLAGEFPHLRLAIVPRHPQRFDEVAELLARSGLPWARRSTLVDSEIRTPNSAIILVDTIGELGAWWGTATIGFVGGSFGSRGGQNMLEPAAYGVATCFGPNTWNFRDIVAQLLAVEGAVVVADTEQLEQFVRRALTAPAWAVGLAGRARSLVLSQQGATRRTLELLLPLVELQIPQEIAA